MVFMNRKQSFYRPPNHYKKMDNLTIASYIILILIMLYLIYRKEILGFLIRKQEFKCIDCVKCCRLYVKLTPKDIKRIKKAGHKEGYFIENTKKGKILKRINTYCIFLSINKGKSKCKIYSRRPDICRSFPNIKIFNIKANDPRCDAFKLPRFLP